MALPFVQSRSGSMTGPVLVGAVCGLAWSASVRGWMTQVAGPASTFH